RLSLDHQEFFGFGVVVVPTTGYTRMCRKERKLAGVPGFQHLYKHAARVAMLRHFVRKACWWEITDISRVQRPYQARSDRINNQVSTAVTESLKLPGQVPNADFVDWIDVNKGGARYVA